MSYQRFAATLQPGFAHIARKRVFAGGQDLEQITARDAQCAAHGVGIQLRVGQVSVDEVDHALTHDYRVANTGRLPRRTGPGAGHERNAMLEHQVLQLSEFARGLVLQHADIISLYVRAVTAPLYLYATHMRLRIGSS